MRIQPVTQQVESKRPLSRTCRNACLVHIYPTGLAMGTRHLLGNETIVLGRGDDCDITVVDHSVSRRHVRFDLDIDGYLVTDLDSTNGSFVNDTPAKSDSPGRWRLRPRRQLSCIVSWPAAMLRPNTTRSCTGWRSSTP